MPCCLPSLIWRILYGAPCITTWSSGALIVAVLGSCEGYTPRCLHTPLSKAWDSARVRLGVLYDTYLDSHQTVGP